MLTAAEVPSFLLRRGLITASAVVDGTLQVADLSRRNRNFKVARKVGSSYLLKQAKEPSQNVTIAREASIYGMLSGAAAVSFRPFIPQLYGYDDERHMLILELIPDAQDLNHFHRRRGRFPSGLGASLGDAIAVLHRKEVVEEAKQTFVGFDQGPSWALSMHNQGLSALRNLSYGNLKLTKILQQFGGFGENLDRLLEGWRAECLIHFDLRWENLLVTPSKSGKRVDLKIIDWEFAGLGDPCWDVGTIFSDYLSFWVSSMPITGDTEPERFVKLARYPLVKMQPAIRAFWRAYVGQKGIPPEAVSEWLLRSANYAAIRLIETAHTRTQMSLKPSGDVILLLQLALNILQGPQEAIVHLLGIPLIETLPA